MKLIAGDLCRALSERQRHALESHLERCDSCRQTADLCRASAVSNGSPPPERSSPAPPQPARDDLEVGSVVGSHVVLRHLGSGGMGSVYMGYDPMLERRVALKVLRSDAFLPSEREVAQARLVLEGQAQARLSHPNVAGVYEVVRRGDDVVLVLEYIEGAALRTWLRQERRTADEVLAVFRQAGAGLAAAHESNVIHRDLKPSNIMVGRDGRVCVADFGLAVVSARVHASREQTTTESRGYAGTLGYIAPEILEGGPATPRSDQFSFCVALYESLFGALPFRGTSIDEFIEATRRGPTTMAAGLRVSRRVRRALVRGLQSDPGQRFASMQALIDALVDRPSYRAIVVGSGIAAAGLAAVLAVPATEPCAQPHRHLADVWAGPRRDAIRSAVLGKEKQVGSTIWSSVSELVDDYARRWTDIRRKACEATYVHREQSDQLLDLRMACLDARLAAMRALGDQLLSPDMEISGKAIIAASKLPSLDPCSNRQALLDQTPLPKQTEQREAISDIRAQLESAMTFDLMGRYQRAFDEAKRAATAADALGWAPLQAEAQYVLGRTANHTRDTDLELQAFHRAGALALASSHAEVLAKTNISMVHAVGINQAKPAESEVWVAWSKAALAAYGNDPLLQARRLENVAVVLFARGEYQEAARLERRGLELRVKALGEDHPLVGDSLYNLAASEIRAGEVGAAIKHLQRARTIFRTRFGQLSPRMSITLNLLGVIQMQTGQLTAALESFREGRHIDEQIRGKKDDQYYDTIENEALTLHRLGNADEAHSIFNNMIPQLVAILGPDHPRISIVKGYLAMVLVKLGRYAEAERLALAALEGIQASFSQDHPELANAATALGQVALARNEVAQSLKYLEQAHAIRSANDSDPYRRWLTGFALAQARWRQGNRSDEAIATAQAALDQIEDYEAYATRVRRNTRVDQNG